MSHEQTLTPVQANAVYSALVAHAGAREDGREAFVFCLSGRGTSEYRFMGALGFGGKFWPDEWRVTCYSEDRTFEVNRKLVNTNEVLKELKKLMGA